MVAAFSFNGGRRAVANKLLPATNRIAIYVEPDEPARVYNRLVLDKLCINAVLIEQAVWRASIGLDLVLSEGGGDIFCFAATSWRME